MNNKSQQGYWDCDLFTRKYLLLYFWTLQQGFADIPRGCTLLFIPHDISNQISAHVRPIEHFPYVIAE